MGTIFIILYLIILVITIIMIVKFFQIASDVKTIKKGQFPDIIVGYNENYDKFCFLAYNGYIEEAKRLILIIIWNDINFSNMRQSKTMDDFNKHYDSLKKNYGEYFDLLNEKFPDYSLISSKIKE